MDDQNRWEYPDYRRLGIGVGQSHRLDEWKGQDHWISRTGILLSNHGKLVQQ